MLDNEPKYMIRHHLRSFVKDFMYLVHLNNPAGSHWGSQPALDRFKVQTEFDIWTLQHASHPSDRKAPAGRGFLGMLKLLFFCLYWSHNNGGTMGLQRWKSSKVMACFLMHGSHI